MPKKPRIPINFFATQSTLVNDVRQFGRSLRQFDEITNGLEIPNWLQSKALRAGRIAIEKFVSGYARAMSAKAYYADARVFGGIMAPQAVDAIWVIAASILASPEPHQIDVRAATKLALGGDPVSQAFRAVAIGQTLPGNPPSDAARFPPPKPNDRIQLDDHACASALAKAFTNLGIAAATPPHAVQYPGMSITGLTPTTACAGETIHVSGTGFGSAQPADAIVVFGTTHATIIASSWSNSGFDIKVPPSVSECCVSVLREPHVTPGSVATPGSVSVGSALSDLADVVTRCFGSPGAAVGSRFEGLAARIPTGDGATCAPDGSNRFFGGPPQILFFRMGGSAASQRAAPGRPIDLSWNIANATSATLSITPAPANSPFAVTPELPAWFAANSKNGSVQLPAPAGLVPWNVRVTLTAHNRCGDGSAALDIGYAPSPGVVFVGGGMKSAFHIGAIEALSAMPFVSPTIFAGSGLGGLSAACAAADYPDPASLRTFWDMSTGYSSWYRTNAAAFVPGGDYAAFDNAMWQAENRAEVLTLGALDLLRAYLVPYTPSDPRTLETVVAAVAGFTADKAVDGLSDALKDALQEANQTALSYVPIVNLIWMAAKFAINLFLDNLKQQTANLLATQPSILDNTNLQALITSTLTDIDLRLGASGNKLRIPILSLELGRARYGTDSGVISDVPVPDRIVTNVGSIAPIVAASVTVPLMGRPVKLGTDNYIDGSLRDPVPIGAAIEAGAETVIVIQPNNRLIAAEGSYDAAGMPMIDARTSLARDAQFLDQAVEAFGRFKRDPTTGTPVGSWRAPVYVIEPTVQLIGLGASYGDPGLVTIMSDYGYMRTYDALVPWLLFPDPIDETQTTGRNQMIADLSASTDRIVGLRVAAWELEHTLNGWMATPIGPTDRIGGGPLVRVPDESAITDIRARKTDIHDALLARLAIPARYLALTNPANPPAPLPLEPIPRARAMLWYLTWEKHSFDQVVDPVVVTPAMPHGDPWVSLMYGDLWTVPAATPPPNLPP
jgi:predicted acylesterase/phospholipase RssA